jgi:hypothetical protein
MSHLIDYAGMFPPAKLPLERAFENYQHYRQGAADWILGRFVIPARQLADLDVPAGETVALSLIGTSGETAAAFQLNLEQDLQAAVRFQSGTIETFEIRLPEKIAGVNLDQLLSETRDKLAEIGSPQLYVEAPADQRLAVLVPTLAQIRAGYKLRCGGSTPGSIPTPEQVARAILVARDHRVPLKFTAGLHHPVRHEAPELYGFFNVFGAGLLAHIYHLSPRELLPILEDENAEHFVFDQHGFVWNGYRVTTDEILTLRQHALIAYGSCSFDEPYEDLRALHLL